MTTPEKVIVTVCEGKIQGFKNRSTFSGVEFYSFLGVPYGESTAGRARFKDPVAVKPWKNILNANVEKGGCFQFSLNQKRIIGSEDCLYNNIHTPKLPQNGDRSLKAVIFSVHPGAHHCGSPDPQDFGSPNYVMHNDIVYVGVSFRLHILGYLNLDLEECSGNQALKDIILSLRWIQKNISNFGGDPNNITLIGSSSGASVVNHLITSPRAKGLFHKAVMMGMYKYCPINIIRDHNSTVAFELAQNMGYNGPRDKKKLLSFYKKLDMRKLIFSRPERFFIEGFAPLHPVSPFLVTNDFGENPVVPPFSKEVDLKSLSRIPLLIGFCNRETVMGFLPPFKKSTMDNFYKSIQQNFLGWGSKLNENQLKILRNRIDSYYLNGKSIENTSLELRCDIQTDIALSDLYTSLVNVVAADCLSSVYVYKFEFKGNVPKMKYLYEFALEEPLHGTYHGDDYSHWADCRVAFDTKGDPLTPETEEMVKTFTKLICTFAKTGNPNYDGVTTQWKPTTVENPCYLSIDDDLQLIDGKLNGKRMEFWENLKKELETNDLTSEFAPFYPNSPFLMTTDFGENPVVLLSNKQNDFESMARIPLMIGFCENETVMEFLNKLQMTLFKDLCKKNFYKSIPQNSWGWGSKLNDIQLDHLQNRIESYKSIPQNSWGWGSKLNDIQLDHLQNRIESYYLDGKSIKTASLSLKCNIQTDIALSDVYTSHINVLAADLPSSVYVYKFGSPNYAGITTQWEPTTVKNPRYMSINNNLTTVDGKLNGQRMEFWENLKNELETNVHAA